MISVVVPIYNTKVFLPHCIDSIINQEFKELEIILVDDGSTDGSETLCDEYAKKDSRVRVIHQKNKGLVFSRRVGAKAASSRWISYVDSDDWIENSMFIEMHTILENHPDVDMVIGGSFHDKGTGMSFQKRGTIPSGIYEKKIMEEIVPRMMYDKDNNGDWGIVGSAWGKIYNRDILLSVLENIDDRITYGEDDALVYGMIPLCNKIAIMDNCFYHYRIHPDSMATSYNIDSYFKLRLLKEYFEDSFKKIGIWQEQKAGVHQFLLRFLMQAMKAEYDIDFGYQFPFGLVEPGSNIVLYGAGVVGKCYYNSLMTADCVNVVLWADKNYETISKQGYPISAPKDILDISYDYVVIAVEGQQNFERIRDDLINLGIGNNKIIWKEARLIDV